MAKKEISNRATLTLGPVLVAGSWAVCAYRAALGDTIFGKEWGGTVVWVVTVALALRTYYWLGPKLTRQFQQIDGRKPPS